MSAVNQNTKYCQFPLHSNFTQDMKGRLLADWVLIPSKESFYIGMLTLLQLF